ncbi:hypothetical protein ASC64_18760 [Nocardioides sp. Root122]|uniref:PP2C family protein-serine/threonine phosphatase n=1 Tax=Nocardioides TaxID=1839 RepID=UPI000703185A|nr:MULTISPECIES: PP2C family protein-serine/threonine phosphatase [Nocardioides]KQV73481.1 hypothetical protein ASC64_18760 [Nocardioides sp. Root122]MCK9825259.1 serine/threonine-protein phosphatase [Nocardioides cavernae]
MNAELRKGGVELAGATLLSLVLLDVLFPQVSLAVLFALSPMVACAVLPPKPTAAFGVAALSAAVASHWWTDDSNLAQHVVRVAGVVAFSATAAVVAHIRVRREHELQHVSRLAEVAQRAVLPVLPAHARRVDIAVRYRSATEDAVIGGDLYDCYHSRNHTRFLVGDVRGKGLGAVEQAARVIRSFRQAAAFQQDLEAVADDMNSYLLPFFDPEEFVTAILLDTTDASRPHIVTAGHPPPLLIHPDGSSEFVEVDNDLPLGLGFGYARHDFTWEPGDRLLLYTDGLSEARDAQGEFLDLVELAPHLVGLDVDAAADRLLDLTRDHSRGSTDAADDMAVLVLEHAVDEQDYRPEDAQHDWGTSLPR